MGFEATARLGSVSAAAQSLHLTSPAITHQIHNLEHSLGLTLFERRGRSVALTPAGDAFYPFVAAALQQIAQGVDTLVQHRQGQETLKVQAYITAAIRLLGPRIAKFQQAFPQISLQLDSASRWDFDPQQADVALVFKESGQVSEHNWRGLFPYQVTPICAPSLLQGLANPASVAHILSLPLIEVHTQEQYWDMWLEAAGLEALKSRSTLSVDTLAIALEMALGGEGVALINGPFATRELDQGSLVLPFDCPLVLGEWGLVYAKDSPRQVQIEAFVDWIEHDLSTR